MSDEERGRLLHEIQMAAERCLDEASLRRALDELNPEKAYRRLLDSMVGRLGTQAELREADRLALLVYPPA